MNGFCYYLNLIFKSYPDFNYKQSKLFSWYSAEKRICFVKCNKKCNKDDKPCINFYKVAHELGHALLNHQDYKTKIELNRMELDAWAEAEKIVSKFGKYKIPGDIIDEAMGSYVNNANQDECPNCELSLIAGVCINCSVT